MNFLKTNSKIVVSSSVPADYRTVEEYIDSLCKKYKFITHEIIGKSYLGKNIAALILGRGQKKSIYIGTHHGMEWITSLLLLRYIEDYCEACRSGARIYGYDSDYLFANRSVIIIPMLNPDGADLAVRGLKADNPVADRLYAMNGSSTDFTKWQANARGVDLNHNYDANWQKCRSAEIEMGIDSPGPTRYGGEYPESEPEVQALTAYIRSTVGIRLLAALHTQGEVIYWDYEGVPAKSKTIGEMLSRSTGYAIDTPENIASHGGCKDWFISEFNLPGFTIECGKGTNPLPITDFIPIYSKINEALTLCSVM